MPLNPRAKYHRVNDKDGYVDAQVKTCINIDLVKYLYFFHFPVAFLCLKVS